MHNNEVLNEVIKRARQSGMTIDSIADESGVNRATIYRILKNEVHPKIDVIMKIANACGVQLAFVDKS